MNESETRAGHIDPALAAAGWGVVEGSRVRREYYQDIAIERVLEPSFEQIGRAVLKLREAINRPPDGFQRVGGQVREAVRIAKAMKTAPPPAARTTKNTRRQLQSTGVKKGG